MLPKTKDTGANDLARLLERSLSQTQMLVKEADSIFARLARNRAAMSRRPRPAPATAAPGQVVKASEETKPTPPLADVVPTPPERSRAVNVAPSASRTSARVTEGEFSGLTPIFESRGFVVNADMRRLFDLSVVKASARLRLLVDAELLLHQGMGTASRYFRGARWPEAQRHEAERQEQTQMPRLRMAMATDLIALAQFAAGTHNARLTCPTVASSLEPAQGSPDSIAADLRSPFEFLMLAEDEELRIVGYVHTVIRRKARLAPTGFIRGLVVDPQQSPNLAHRLLLAAIKIMSESQVGEIKVQAAEGDSRLRGLLEDSGFHVNSVEMTFTKGT